MAIPVAVVQRIVSAVREEFIERVIPSHLTLHLQCLSQVDEEKVLAKEKSDGPTTAAEELLNRLVRRPGWFDDLIQALEHENIDLPDLAHKIKQERSKIPIVVNIGCIEDQYGSYRGELTSPVQNLWTEDMDVEEGVVYPALLSTAKGLEFNPGEASMSRAQAGGITQVSLYNQSTQNVVASPKTDTHPPKDNVTLLQYPLSPSDQDCQKFSGTGSTTGASANNQSIQAPYPSLSMHDLPHTVSPFMFNDQDRLGLIPTASEEGPGLRARGTSSNPQFLQLTTQGLPPSSTCTVPIESHLATNQHSFTEPLVNTLFLPGLMPPGAHSSSGISQSSFQTLSPNSIHQQSYRGQQQMPKDQERFTFGPDPGGSRAELQQMSWSPSSVPGSVQIPTGDSSQTLQDVRYEGMDYNMQLPMSSGSMDQEKVIQGTSVQSKDVPQPDQNIAAQREQLIYRFMNIIQGVRSLEEISSLNRYLNEMEVQVMDVREGSLLLLLTPHNSSALEHLWELFCSGTLTNLVQRAVVTPERYQKLLAEAETMGFHLKDVKLKAEIDPDEYSACKTWILQKSELVTARNEMESMALYSKQYTALEQTSKELVTKRVKMLRSSLPFGVRQILQDPFISPDFQQKGGEIFKMEITSDQIEEAGPEPGLKQKTDLKESRHLVYNVMTWIEIIYNDHLSQWPEKFQTSLSALALGCLGNICIMGTDDIIIVPEGNNSRMRISKEVAKFLEKELTLASGMPPFHLPGAILEAFFSESGLIEISIDRLLADDILFAVPFKESSYRFVSPVLRDFLIGNMTHYKIVPAVARTTKSTLLEHAHKFPFLHLLACNPTTKEPLHAHIQVVINIFKELEKRSVDQAHEFAVTLLHSLEFSPQAEAKSGLEYFSSKIKLVHREGIFKTKQAVYSLETKQFLSACLWHNILYRVELVDASTEAGKGKDVIVRALKEFSESKYVPMYNLSGCLNGLDGNDFEAVLRSIEVLDVVSMFPPERTKEGALVVDLQKMSSALHCGIEVDLSHNSFTQEQVNMLILCFKTLPSLNALSFASVQTLKPEDLQSFLVSNCMANLTSLNIAHVQHFSSLSFQIRLRYVPNLMHLNLSNCGITDQALPLALSDLKYLPRLKSLNMGHNSITSVGLTKLSAILSAHVHALASLDIQSNPLGPKAGIAICVILQSNVYLEELMLSNCNLGNIGVASLADSFPQSLKVLELSGNVVTLETLKGVVAGLMHCHTLQKLVLEADDNEDSTSEISKEVLGLFQMSSAWFHLDLRNCNLSHSGAFVDPKQIEVLSELCSFRLIGDKIDNQGALELAKCLKVMTFLSDLDLSGNLIRDEGIESILKVLDSSQNLETLNLAGNQISVDGVGRICENLKNFSSIKLVNLSKNLTKDILTSADMERFGLQIVDQTDDALVCRKEEAFLHF